MQVLEEPFSWYIKEDGGVLDGRKVHLRSIAEGNAWRWLSEYVFPSLSCVTVTATVRPRPTSELFPVRDTVTVYVHDTVFVTKSAPSADTFLPAEGVTEVFEDINTGEKQEELISPVDPSKLIFAFRHNILLPALNAGFELPIGDRVSMGATAYFPWCPRESTHMECFQFAAADLDLRFWFRKPATKRDRLLGPSLGVYAAMGIYDFEHAGAGNQGWFQNVGLDYLHSIRLGKNLRMQFELGFGYIYSEVKPYDCLEPGGQCYERKDAAYNLRWWGPTRAMVSLVVPIYSKPKSN